MPDELEASNHLITHRFFETFDLSHVSYFHCFVPMVRRNEVDASLIYKTMWRDFPSVKTATSVIDRTNARLKNFRFTTETQMVENLWGVMEPRSVEEVAPADLDIVIVPLLCFDKNGHRVGYGRGYYDRFLKNCRTDCRKIGLSYFPPVDSIDDASSHDVTLDFAVTPELVYSGFGHDDA